MLVVENETYRHCPFRSSFAVTSGVYYYEAIPRNGGRMRFGWATRQAELSESREIGDDKHSIGLELENDFYMIYPEHGGFMNRTNKEKYKNSNVSQHKSPTVIGCLIDTVNRQFTFYINGQQVKLPDNVHFSKWPYYATVGLGKGQECQLNFGNVPFNFPPKDIQFNDFNEISEKKYQLAKTVEYNFNFWFAHPVMANRVDLFYCDPEQREYDEFVRQFKHTKHIETTGLVHWVACGRLIQSVIEVVSRRLACDHNDQVTICRLMREVIERTEVKCSQYEKVKLLELLYPYLQLSTVGMSVTSMNSIKCHNISTILLFLLLSPQKYFSDQLVKNFYKLDVFLLKCSSIETFQLFFNPKIFITEPLKMIDILSHLESLPLPRTKRLLLNDSTLWWCSELFGHVSSVSRLYEPSCDLVRLQVGMCARWFRDHVIQGGKQLHFPSQSTLNPEDKTEHIKLSSDCLSARNDFDGWQSVCSVCSVVSGIFYYEAVLITDGWMRIGWATKQIDLNKNAIGGARHSIGFDGKDGNGICHQGENFYDKSLISNFIFQSQWSVGDIVGCLIDCDKKIFRFYLNGELMKCKEKLANKNGDELIVHFSKKPYYAAVCLGRSQQCYLNLGQCFFRHPPSVPFRTFHNQSLSHVPPPTPFYPPHLTDCYSLVQVLAKDRVVRLFDDEKQKECDEFEMIEENISNFNQKTEVDRLRLLQSVIEVHGPSLLDSNLSVHASWIAHLITQSTWDNPAFPNLVAQLLYPYFTLHLNKETSIKHRNVCIVLSSLISVVKDFKERINLYQLVFQYLVQIASNCIFIFDEWLLLYSLIGLSNLDLESNANFSDLHNAKKDFLEMLIDFSKNKSIFLVRQLDFLSQWTFDRLFNSNQTNQHFPLTDHETLDPSNCSAHLKLSSNFLSARSDRNWQSGRSLSSISSKQYYYEVTLVTSGPMRFGWGAENVDLTKSILGEDEHGIGFDGYNRCVWHRGRHYWKAHYNIPQWKVGDVVGCMILPEEKRFAFYLNGIPIVMSFLANYTSDQSYYPAASLFTFQQCTFNFQITTNIPTIKNHILISNRQIDLMFDDKKQTTLDKTVKLIDCAIDSKYRMVTEIQNNESLRMIQSFIEVSGEQFIYDKMDHVIKWTDQMIVQSATDSSFLDNLVHLLYPYFTLHLVDETASKHRNVCFVLSSLIQHFSEFPINLNVLTLTYLTEIVCTSDDELILMIVLIVLGNMTLNEEERNKLKSNDKFCNALKSLTTSSDLNDITILSKVSIIGQLVFLSQWTFDYLLNSNQSNLHFLQTNRETLDPANCTAHLKLSPDRLSARSDRNWQSVRSITSLSSKSYYFEVTLTTSGPMRIGWAAENVKMKESILGDDKYSIAFDGYNRCIWHGGKQLPIRNVPQWTVGDVVGCLVFISEKRFKFYLNQQTIKLPLLASQPYFSSVKSYYAAASLFTFQQCQFNFSVKTKISPSESFRVLDAARNSIDKGCRHVMEVFLTGATVINSWINVGSRIEAGNVTLSHISGNYSKEISPSNLDPNMKSQSAGKIKEQPHGSQVINECDENELTESEKIRD